MRAASVFPTPGGPAKMRKRAGSTPWARASAGCRSGSSTWVSSSAAVRGGRQISCAPPCGTSRTTKRSRRCLPVGHLRTEDDRPVGGRGLERLEAVGDLGQVGDAGLGLAELPPGLAERELLLGRLEPGDGGVELLERSAAGAAEPEHV